MPIIIFISSYLAGHGNMPILKLNVLLFMAALSICRITTADIDRPIQQGQQATQIHAMVYLVDLDKINTAEQSFDANVYFMFSWLDPRLAHQNPQPIRRPLTEVWHPNIQIANQQKIWSTFPEVAEITPAGQVSYTQRIWGSFSQPLSLHDFPFDQQVFGIRFVSAGHKQHEIEFITEKKQFNGIADKLSIPDWDIIAWQVSSQPFQLNPHTNTLSSYELSFTAKRRVDYYIVNVVVPLLLIVAMSWVVFWVDPKESGTQISVAITSMLTLIAYRFAIGASLPKLSYLTRLDEFILLSTLLVFSSLVEAVVTSSLSKSHRQELALKIDHWCRWIFPVLLLMVCFKSFYY